MDASSAFQDSLPLSSDALLRRLDQHGMAYQRIDHPPLKTVSDAKQVRDGFLSVSEGGGHIKNLYLRDNKKHNYLVVLQEDRQFDLHYIADKIGAARLSFGSADRLFDVLGVRAGAVTPLSMINGVSSQVRLYLDAILLTTKQIYMHPLVNDRTIGITPATLEIFLTGLDAQYQWVNFDQD